MAIQATLAEDYDPDKQGYDAPLKGRYHVVILDCDEDGARLGSKKGEMVIECEIVAGTTPGQEGKRFRIYYTKSVKAMGRIHQLAMASGMITSEQIKKLRDAKQEPVYEFDRDLKMRQMCVELEDHEYNGKTQARCGWGFYHVGNPRVKDWPKNAGFLKKLGAGAVMAGTNGAAAGAGHQAPTAPQKPATAAAGVDLSNIEVPF